MSLNTAVSVARALLLASSDVTGKAGHRIYPDVPANAARPFVRLSRTGEQPQKPLGTGDAWLLSSVDVLVVGATEASVSELLSYCKAALDKKSGTIAGVAVIDTEVEGLNDQTDVPSDLDDGQSAAGNFQWNLLSK